MNVFYSFYDKIKTIYWNNLKLSNIVIAIILVLIFRQVLEFSSISNELNIIIFTNKSGIYTIIATIAGTLLGFIITSISIIVTFTSSDKLDLLKEEGFYDELFGVYFDTIKSLAITTVISTIGMFYSDNIIWFYIFLVSAIISILLFSASIWVLETLITIVKN